MSRIETALPAPPRGASRVYDIVYPIPRFCTTTTDLGNDVITRQGTLVSGIVAISSSGAVETHKSLVYGGQVAYALSVDGASTLVVSLQTTFRLRISTEQPAANPVGDYMAWRVACWMAFGSAGNGAGDYGLELCAADTPGDMITAGSRGILIGPSGAANDIAVRARQSTAGALTINDTLSAAVDIAEYNLYEFRLVSARGSNEAAIGAYVNGRQYASYAWGVGTLLPADMWKVCICNRAMIGPLYLPMCGLNVSASPTATALL